MMDFTKQVAKFLQTKGLLIFDETGLTGNTFIQTSPDKPDESISIYSTGGPPGDRKKVYRRGTIQIVIRTKPNDPRIGESKAEAIISALNGFNSDYLETGGNFVIDTEAMQAAPNNIGQDETDRFEFSQNFLFEYEI